MLDQKALADAYHPDRGIFSQGGIECRDRVVLASEDDAQVGQYLVHVLPVGAGAECAPIHLYCHRYGTVNVDVPPGRHTLAQPRLDVVGQVERQAGLAQCLPDGRGGRVERRCPAILVQCEGDGAADYEAGGFRIGR